MVFMKKLTILGIAGSLRKGSFNKSILRAAQNLVPEDVGIEIFDIEGIPSFNQDLVNDPPEIVTVLKEKVRSADAILFATPEYNYSIPGVLKNMIDWVSRANGENTWQGKPVAIMSASTGMIGGERAQLHLRQCFVYLDMHPVNRPEVIVTFASQKIDQNGNIIDEHTNEKIKELLVALVEMTKKCSER
jgi:chromate reductase, NAD(P)H dehydrogenase (quinone)